MIHQPTANKAAVMVGLLALLCPFAGPLHADPSAEMPPDPLTTSQASYGTDEGGLTLQELKQKREQQQQQEQKLEQDRTREQRCKWPEEHYKQKQKQEPRRDRRGRDEDEE